MGRINNASGDLGCVRPLASAFDPVQCLASLFVARALKHRLPEPLWSWFAFCNLKMSAVQRGVARQLPWGLSAPGFALLLRQPKTGEPAAQLTPGARRLFSPP